MQQLIRQLMGMAHGAWRYRWHGLAVAWIAAAIGAVGVTRLPDRYEAHARVFVDTQSILKPLLAGLIIQPDTDQQIAMLSRTLLSRPNLEKLAEMTEPDFKSRAKAQQDVTIDRLARMIEVKRTDRDNLYNLAYRDGDADRARRVVQSLVTIFVQSGQGASRKDADSAKNFLDEQIRAYEAKLTEAETRMKAFKLRQIDAQMVDGRDSSQRLTELAAQLDKAKLDLREAENSRDAARMALEQEKTQRLDEPGESLLAQAAVQVSTPEIDARLEAQRRGLDALLQRFTDSHPDVASARRLIRELEEEKGKEIAELRRRAAAAATARPAAVGNGSVASQELSRVLATVEVQVAALRARVSEYQGRYAQARAAVKTAPAVEAEAAQLNRDYEIHKRSYEDLVRRREAAVMSGNLEEAAGVTEFRVVDPPSVRPVSVNRVITLSAVAAGALLLGLGVALGLGQLRPVFRDVAELRERFGLPVLGAVASAPNGARQRKARIESLRFWLASGTLLGAFAVGISTASMLSPR